MAWSGKEGGSGALAGSMGEVRVEYVAAALRLREIAGRGREWVRTGAKKMPVPAQ